MSALEKQIHSSASVDENDRILYISRDRPIRISTGHRILHHNGKCRPPHGHNYAVSVAVTGTLTEDGWIVDKGDITDVISDWDHRFLVEQGRRRRGFTNEELGEKMWVSVLRY